MSTLQLYRNLLKAAKIYPSRNQNRILKDIKESFRANRALTDEKLIEKEIKEAHSGLKLMSDVNRIKSAKKDWSFTVGGELK